jgi:hypothetical protein
MALAFLILIVALALAAPFLGADSRDGLDRKPFWPHPGSRAQLGR